MNSTLEIGESNNPFAEMGNETLVVYAEDLLVTTRQFANVFAAFLWCGKEQLLPMRLQVLFQHLLCLPLVSQRCQGFHQRRESAVAAARAVFGRADARGALTPCCET